MPNAQRYDPGFLHREQQDVAQRTLPQESKIARAIHDLRPPSVVRVGTWSPLSPSLRTPPDTPDVDAIVAIPRPGDVAPKSDGRTKRPLLERPPLVPLAPLSGCSVGDRRLADGSLGSDKRNATHTHSGAPFLALDCTRPQIALHGERSDGDDDAKARPRVGFPSARVCRDRFLSPPVIDSFTRSFPFFYSYSLGRNRSSGLELSRLGQSRYGPTLACRWIAIASEEQADRSFEESLSAHRNSRRRLRQLKRLPGSCILFFVYFSLPQRSVFFYPLVYVCVERRG